MNGDTAATAAYLAQLSPEDRVEALAAAVAAQRAEERAEARELERAIAAKHAARRHQQQDEVAAAAAAVGQQRRLQGTTHSNNNGSIPPYAMSTTLQHQPDRVVFVPKRNRDTAKPESNGPLSASAAARTIAVANHKPESSTTASSSHHHHQQQHSNALSSSSSLPLLSEHERLAILETYLGKSKAEREEEHLQKRKKLKSNKKITFKFRWDDADDTSSLAYNNNNNEEEQDPLYAPLRLQSSTTTTARATGSGKQQWHRRIMGDERAWSTGGGGSNNSRNGGNNNNNTKGGGTTNSFAMDTVMQKPLTQMAARDWRIVRENFEITVRGGRAPPPMRSFAEPPHPSLPPLHPALLDAIFNVLQYREPSPIQRQAIPIGLQRRDLIGISETGSGKTVAFGLPMCHYLLNLAPSVLSSVADQGPLALVMAPTRELALQIDGQLQSLLSRQQIVRSCAIVGGQPIQHQAQIIRKGVHIIVGTPGRINECIEMAYLVLNQCCYIIMDEADRMIDMGFAPQMESILDAMGGTMKSENESETYRQEMEDLQKAGVARHRLTAMFSATMPLEVERIAKCYLRHPAIISIGDTDSGKNSRIVQKLVWVPSPSKKEDALRDLLRDPRFIRDKVIVFVNEKKHADSVGRMVERSGRQCVVLHGGKSQEQREENLQTFRKGGIVLVATDVAGRGLDIPDVAHVINYDLPTRSIENYTHRIGRTGRAGKEGLATSLISDEDEGIMSALHAYLISTGNAVPDRLARHSSVKSSAPGDSVMY